MLTEVVHALVLQSDAVEHARGRLDHTRIVIALARLQGSTLNDYAANAVKRHKVGKLRPVAERSRCGHYRILQPQVLYPYT